MAKSKYYGVTYDDRVKKFKGQLVINGKPRFLGYFERDTDAARVAQSARHALQEFFPKLPKPINADLVALPGILLAQSDRAINGIKNALRGEKAETYTHLQKKNPNPVTTLKDMAREVKRGLARAKRALNMIEAFTRNGGISSP